MVSDRLLLTTPKLSLVPSFDAASGVERLFHFVSATAEPDFGLRPFMSPVGGIVSSFATMVQSVLRPNAWNNLKTLGSELNTR